MPLTAAGKLTIVASSDLGGARPEEGQAVVYSWVPPGIAPLLLPWLAILGLLALKPNRCAAAWWIWLPPGCVIAFTLAPLPTVPSASEFYSGCHCRAGGWSKRRLAPFGLSPADEIGLLLFYACCRPWRLSARWPLRRDWIGIFSRDTMVSGILLAVGVCVSAAALSLAGLLCRGRGRYIGLYGWLLILLVAIWLLITAPFFVLRMMTVTSGVLPWTEFIAPVVAVAMVHFAILLPFLILSSASPFYRQRLKALLQMEPATPPVMAPLPETNLKT